MARNRTFKNDFVKPEDQRGLARFGLARTDDKPRGETELLRLSRGAKEEDEVNFRSSESRTLSLLNCYAECRRKSSSIKCLNLFERYNLHVTLNLARANIASATGGQGDGSLLLVIPQAGYLPADDNEVEDGDEGKNRQP